MTETSPVLPAIKASDWLGREHALCRPLVPEHDLVDSPWVGFGYDHPTTFEFLTRESFPSGNLEEQVRLIEQAAIRNLRLTPAHWRLEEMTLGVFRRLRLLVCSEDFLSTERILDEQFLQQAQAELKAKQIAVGIPCRGLLLATNAHQNKNSLARFSAMISAQYHRSRTTPISPMVFLVKDGRIIGIVTGQEAAGLGLPEGEALVEPQVYINAVISTDHETGQETLHLVSGGPDFDRLAKELQPAFKQSIEQVRSRPEFSGSIRIVLAPELTPKTANLPGQMAELERRYRSQIAALYPQATNGRPIEVQVAYGPPDHIPTLYPVEPELLVDLLNALRSQDVNARRKSADALARRAGIEPVTGDLVDGLVAALNDPDIQVRTLAAEAAARAGEKAIEPLKLAFMHGDGAAREFALVALRGIDEHRFTDLFLQALDDCEPGVRRRAVGALVDLVGSMPVETLLGPLLRAIKDGDPFVRALAASGLGRLGRTDMASPLIAALSDPSGEVRSKAAHSLGEIKNRRATPYLVGTVKDPYLWARIFSIWALGELGDPRGAEALVSALVQSYDPPDLQLRTATVAAIRKLGVSAVSALRAARDRCDRKKEKQKRQQITELLREIRLRSIMAVVRRKPSNFRF